MIKLIVTADDALYERLAGKAQAEGDVPWRAMDVLDGLGQARKLATSVRVSFAPPGSPDPGLGQGTVVVDMALHAADTLIETLHSLPETSGIPLLAVKPGGGLPFEIRRLCVGVLEADAL